MFGRECILLLAAACFIISRPPSPTDADNKGDITISEFAENYNELLPYNSYHYLNSVGKWADDTPQGTVVVNTSDYIYPTYRCITENNPYGSYHSNDIMKGMHFSVDIQAMSVQTLWGLSGLMRILRHILSLIFP